jgi:LysR family hydrogen peroxide-inducible transcriptional activator
MPSVNDLSLRQLQYVVAVAETLGFHRAAERCHVSQPTLSAQVQQVEEVLGVALFERDRRRVLVTAAGEQVVARARRALREVEDLLAAAARMREPFSGTLRIGVIPTIAPYLLPDVTPRMRAAYPKLALVFREEKTADVMRGLEEGALDAGIVALEADVGACARAEIAKDEFVAALPKGHALAKKKRLALADLEGEAVLLLDEGHCFRDQALALCSRVGAEETPFRATSLATLAQMVSSGAGVTLLPELAVAVENRRGQLEVRPFSGAAPSRTIALVWRPTSPLAAELAEAAKTMRRAANRG